MKVVINACFGGFSLSVDATKMLSDLKGVPYNRYDNRPEDRADPLLVQVVEELGKKADGECAKLKVVEIPDGTDYVIQEYDGSEWVAEKHETWS